MRYQKAARRAGVDMGYGFARGLEPPHRVERAARHPARRRAGEPRYSQARLPGAAESIGTVSRYATWEAGAPTHRDPWANRQCTDSVYVLASSHLMHSKFQKTFALFLESRSFYLNHCH
jgi:hypothetical protein